MPLPSPRSLGRTVRESVAVRHLGKLWSAEAVALVAGLVQAVFVARVLGPRDYGVAALVVAYPTLLFTFLDPQAAEAVVRFVTTHRAEGDVRAAAAVVRFAYLVNIGLAALGFAAVVITARWAERFMVHDAGTAGLLVVMAAAISLSAPAVTSRAVLATLDRFGVVAKLNAALVLFKVVLVCGLVGSGAGVRGFVFGTAVSIAVEGAVFAFAAHRAMRDELALSWTNVRFAELGERWRPVASFMLYTELSTLASVAVKQADILVLGWARGPREAGLYRLAMSFIGPVTRGLVPLQSVAYTRLATFVAAGDRARLRLAVRRQALGAGLPLGAAVLSLAAVVHLPVLALVGGEYADAMPAARLLLVAAALATATYWVRPLYQALNEVRALFLLALGTSVPALIGFVLVAEPAGAVGVAAVRAFVPGVAGSFVSLVYLRRLLARAALRSAAADDQTGHEIGVREALQNSTGE